MTYYVLNDGSEPMVECFLAGARAKVSTTHTCTYHMEEIFDALNLSTDSILLVNAPSM